MYSQSIANPGREHTRDSPSVTGIPPTRVVGDKHARQVEYPDVRASPSVIPLLWNNHFAPTHFLKTPNPTGGGESGQGGTGTPAPSNTDPTSNDPNTPRATDTAALGKSRDFLAEVLRYEGLQFDDYFSIDWADDLNIPEPTTQKDIDSYAMERASFNVLCHVTNNILDRFPQATNNPTKPTPTNKMTVKSITLMGKTAMPVSRRQIVRACKGRGWQIQPDALKGLEAYLVRRDEIDGEFLDRLAEYMVKSSKQQTVTKAIWDTFVKEDQQGESNLTTTTSPRPSERTSTSASSSLSLTANPWSHLQVISAFYDVKLVYHTMKKQFRTEEQPWSLFGKAEDKIQMYMQRYALTHQRILRHKLFRPSDLGHLGTANEMMQYKLTPIESLLGRQKQASQKSLLLLGLLEQVEEGQYYLEDSTGQVPISFLHAKVVEGFFVTEGNILLVEGTFQDGILYAQRIGHPLLEERQDSMAVIQQQVRHPAFSMHHPLPSDSPLVILSDVHLDQPRVLQQLEALFASFENYSQRRMPLFCLMGNFCSQFQLHSGEQVRQCLEELAQLIARFPKLAAHAHFCLVPGPNDGVGHVLPYSWPKSLGRMACWNKISNAHLTSNPAKIRWNGRTMTVFRQNVLSLLQQRQIPLPVADDEDGSEIAKVPHLRLVKTLLDQGHLLPVANAPIYWNYDHALSLYPLPDSLILGSSDAAAFHEIYGGVDVIHPGSFAKQGAFARYVPTALDPNDDNQDDDDQVIPGAFVSLDQVDENWNTEKPHQAKQ